MTTGKTFRCSTALRWRQPNGNEIIALMEATHGKHAPVLQQAWECLETGEVEWRDIPLEPPQRSGSVTRPQKRMNYNQDAQAGFTASHTDRENLK